MTTKNTQSCIFPVGKLPQNDLVSLLNQRANDLDDRVILGPGLGRDAAVIEFGDRYLVTKTDPITFATEEIGWYAVNVNANDVACLGARPQWFIATLLLPEGKTDYDMVQSIFTQIHDASHALGISVVGGHTEITHGIDRPIVVGAMFGEVAPQNLVRSDGAQPGDHLILTKGISVEGTAILANEFPAKLSTSMSHIDIERAQNFLHEPGISVVADARIAMHAGKVHAMHDPTEGGVATGISEITEAAGHGALIDAQVLPIYPETQTICDLLDLNPLGVIASGSLLAAVAPDSSESVVQALESDGITATIIGEVTEEPGVFLRNSSGTYPLPQFPRDEIARLF